MGVERIGKLDVPNVLALIEGEETDLIGFGGADLTDPDDAETGFAPEAADFERLTGRSKKPDTIEARAILTEVHGESGLLERAASGVLASDDDAERFRNARFLAGATPETGKRLFEREAHAGFALRVFVHVSDADLLFGAGDPVDQSHRVADGELCFQKDKRATCVDDYGLRFFFERAARGAEAINGNWNMQAHSWAGTRSFF